MPGIRSLRKIQLGREVTPGTSTAATAIWRGEGTLEDTRTIERVAEDVGLVSQTDRQVETALGGTITLTGNATFEQLPYIFSAGIKNVYSPGSTSGSGQIYTYPMPTTQGLSVTTWTIEGGDDRKAEEMQYSFCESITLEGASSEPLTVSATFIGRQISTTTFTASLEIPGVEDILVSSGKFYVNQTGSAFGSTQVSNDIEAVTQNIATGMVADHALDGNKYFNSTHRDGRTMSASMDVRMRYGTSAVNEIEHYRAGTARKVRLEYEGAALGTTGALFSYKTFRTDMRGKWMSFSAIDEEDGVDIVTGTFQAGASTSGVGTAYAQFTIVNELSALQ